jgi:ribosomal protein S12 methylthiotransferase accessory factor
MSHQTMSVNFPGGKRVTASFGHFEIATDQSRENGGDGSAPEPFELFLASLATCAGIYVLGFCQKRNIPTEGIRLTQDWSFEGERKKLTEVRVTIEVPPDFPEKYHGALVRVAEKCKVKKTLEDPPVFSVRTVVVEAVTT